MAVAPRSRNQPPALNPTISWRGSVAAVTSAIAADASRGVRPWTPATFPHAIDAETSRASRSRRPVGSTFPNAVANAASSASTTSATGSQRRGPRTPRPAA